MSPNFKTVLCPRCGATVGSPCQSAGGRKMAAAYPHMDRVRVFAEKERTGIERTPLSSWSKSEVCAVVVQAGALI